MNKIRLTVASRGLYVIHELGSIAIAAVVTVLIFKFLVELNELVFLILVLAIWYPISHFTRKIPNGQVEIEIVQDGIQVIWVKQILLHNKQNCLIPWEQIKDYMFQPEQYFDLLRIRTTDKKKHKFSMVGDNDDFPEFYKNLEKEFRSKSTHDTIEINRAKNFYETKLGLISAIFLGIIIVAGIFVLVFVEPKGNSKPNYGILAFSLIGGVFYISQVISHRKNNNGS